MAAQGGENFKARTILLTGILVREAFSFWTGHPFDFELWVRTGYWVAHGMSPYGVLPPAPGLSFADVYSPSGESTVGYLPFWPLLLGAIYKLYAVVGFGNRFVYYFLIKQPIIAGDLLLGYLISRYVKDRSPDPGNIVLAFWILSPLTIIISSIWGMFDSLAMVFVMVALASRGGAVRSISEGIAIWAKSIPLIFAIPLAFSGPNKARNLLVSLGLPALATLATLVLLHWPLGTAVSTLGTTVNKGGESLSAVGVLFYFETFGVVSWPVVILRVFGYLWIPVLLVTTLLAYRWFGFNTEKGLVQSLILCSIAFMVFKAQVNEQYSIYVLALILVDVGVWNPKKRWFYLAITAAVLVFLAVNNPELERFLAPIDPRAVLTDSLLTAAWGEIRYAVLMASSVVFVALDLAYAALMVRDRKIMPELPLPSS